MTDETLDRANGLRDRLESLRSMRPLIANGTAFNKGKIPEEISAACVAACVAIVDEAIDAIEKEFGGL